MTSSARSILIVDDEDELRDILKTIFLKRGYSVTLASSGGEALEIALTRRFDAIVSDVRMPNGSGIELLASLRRSGDPTPPVILVTGFSDCTEQEAKEKGAFAVVEKPFRQLELIGQVERAIAER